MSDMARFSYAGMPQCTLCNRLVDPLHPCMQNGCPWREVRAVAPPPTSAEIAAEVIRQLKAEGMLRPQEPPEVTPEMYEAANKAVMALPSTAPDFAVIEAGFQAMWRAMQAGQAKEGE